MLDLRGRIQGEFKQLWEGQKEARQYHRLPEYHFAMPHCGAAWCAATVWVDVYHALSYSTDVHFYGPVFSHFLVTFDYGRRRRRGARAAR